jgi:hypothetical protein
MQESLTLAMVGDDMIRQGAPFSVAVPNDVLTLVLLKAGRPVTTGADDPQPDVPTETANLPEVLKVAV